MHDVNAYLSLSVWLLQCVWIPMVEVMSAIAKCLHQTGLKLWQMIEAQYLIWLKELWLNCVIRTQNHVHPYDVEIIHKLSAAYIFFEYVLQPWPLGIGNFANTQCILGFLNIEAREKCCCLSIKCSLFIEKNPFPKPGHNNYQQNLNGESLAHS